MAHRAAIFCSGWLGDGLLWQPHAAIERMKNVQSLSGCDVLGNKSSFTLPCAVGWQPLQCWWDSDADIPVVSHVCPMHS